MKSRIRRTGLFFLLAAMPWLAWAQQPGAPVPAQVQFTYSNPGIQPEGYVLTVREDGGGHYRSWLGPAKPASLGDIRAEPQDRPIRISPAETRKIFAVARGEHFFAIPCDSGNKKIAFQGRKTLAYLGPDGRGSCEFNWSRRGSINGIADDFEAIALTLEEGRRLEVDLAHRRLGVDDELASLMKLVQDGRAKEIGNIAPVLRAIEANDGVLKRDQRRARALLATVPAG